MIEIGLNLSVKWQMNLHLPIEETFPKPTCLNPDDGDGMFMTEQEN